MTHHIPPDQDAEGERPRILIVDDIAANLTAMRVLLRRMDAEIMTAQSGNEALSLALDHRFALVLLDVQMPGMDGFEVATLPFDVTDHAATRAAVDGFEARVGPIDILINNAGQQHRGPLETFPDDAFQRLLQVNVASVFNVAQACARHMIARGRGHIVNICSVQSALARPGIAPYTATKGAVANLTKGMAADWARHGLNCNGLAPGYFETPLNAALVADPAFSDWLARRTPAGRWGRPEDIGQSAVYLAAPASDYVNGAVLNVDGGWLAR